MNMTEPIKIHPSKHIAYGEKLVILRQHESGITTSSILNHLGTSKNYCEILNLRERLERVR